MAVRDPPKQAKSPRFRRKTAIFSPDKGKNLVSGARGGFLSKNFAHEGEFLAAFAGNAQNPETQNMSEIGQFSAKNGDFCPRFGVFLTQTRKSARFRVLTSILSSSESPLGKRRLGRSDLRKLLVSAKRGRNRGISGFSVGKTDPEILTVSSECSLEFAKLSKVLSLRSCGRSELRYRTLDEQDPLESRILTSGSAHLTVFLEKTAFP